MIAIAAPADITYPGRKIGDGDQFITQPGEIGDVIAMHVPGLAFRAWKNRVGTEL